MCKVLTCRTCLEPQFYPECAHLEVSNDDKGVIPSKEYMAKIPGVWSMDRTYTDDWKESLQLITSRT